MTDAPPTENDRAQSLKFSILDGVFFSLMFGFGESYISAYAIFLGASAQQVGILAAFPLWIGALSQLFGVRLLEGSYSRKHIIAFAAIAQAALWIPIAFTQFAFSTPQAAVNAVIILVTLYFIFGNVIVPAWTSLMGDLVSREIRGKYFGRRNKLCGIALFSSMMIGGYLLQVGKKHSFLPAAYVCLFLGACLFRLISSYWLSRHESPPFTTLPGDKFSFWQFLRRMPHSNFARFTLFHALMHFSVFLAGPFFSVYMLRELGMGYFEYTIVIASALLANIFVMQFWGKYGDLFGNKSVLNITSWGIALVPILWVFSSSLPYLILVQIFSGLCWSGFQLSSGNFLLDAVTAPKRGRCTAYLWVLTATAILLGSYAGGFLLDLKGGTFLSAGGYSKYLVLFILSGFLRGLITIFLLKRFKEVREVLEPATPNIYLRIPQVHPFVSGSVRVATAFVKKSGKKKSATQPDDNQQPSQTPPSS